MEVSKRRAVFTELKDFCHMSKEHDFVEVTEWTNGEGYTINVSCARMDKTIDLTYGEFKAIKKAIKHLDKLPI
jgi:hypothetical protein